MTDYLNGFNYYELFPVNARELYKELGIKAKFAHWIVNQKKLGTECKDYIYSKSRSKNGSNYGRHRALFTVAFAKRVVSHTCNTPGASKELKKIGKEIVRKLAESDTYDVWNAEYGLTVELNEYNKRNKSLDILSQEQEIIRNICDKSVYNESERFEQYVWLVELDILLINRNYSGITRKIILADLYEAKY